MDKRQTFPIGLLYSVAPDQFEHLHIHDDPIWDEFGWEDSTKLDGGESLASNVLGFLKGFGAE